MGNSSLPVIAAIDLDDAHDRPKVAVYRGTSPFDSGEGMNFTLQSGSRTMSGCREGVALRSNSSRIKGSVIGIHHPLNARKTSSLRVFKGR